MARLRNRDSDNNHHHKSRNSGDDEANRILQALVEVSETTVKEAMTPRIEVVALPIPVTEEDLRKAIRKSSHSRFPVFDDDLDRLVGVLFVKDLIKDERWWPDTNGNRQGMSPVDISRRLRPPYLVPESKQVLHVLAEMRQLQRDFAVVVDEYGGVSGVITMKDLVSLLVGDLRDEFDQPEVPPITRVDRNRWLVDGNCPIDTINHSLNAEFKEGEYVTIAGLILDVLGKIPQEGDSANLENFEIKVIEMDKRRIAKVLIQNTSASIDKVEE